MVIAELTLCGTCASAPREPCRSMAPEHRAMPPSERPIARVHTARMNRAVAIVRRQR